MTDTSGRLIVMGVDGSAESRAALLWVADEARPTLDAVRVVHAQTGRGPAAALAAEMIVESGVSTLRRLNPRTAVEGVVVAGEPVDVLVECSARAALVVVGGVSRTLWQERRGGGRIGLAVAAKAGCPVVVVPDAAALPSRRLPIAVLATDGDDSDPALSAAFRSAAARGCGLIATSVWDLGTAGHPDDREQVAAWQIEAQQASDRALLRWQGDFPSVPVVSRLRRSGPLVAAGEMHADAQLIVATAPGPDQEPLHSAGFAALSQPSVPVMLIPDSARPSAHSMQSPAGPVRRPSVN